MKETREAGGKIQHKKWEWEAEIKRVELIENLNQRTAKQI